MMNKAFIVILSMMIFAIFANVALADYGYNLSNKYTNELRYSFTNNLLDTSGNGQTLNGTYYGTNDKKGIALRAFNVLNNKSVEVTITGY